MKIDINILTDIGLTADQAEIYLCLLERGSQKAVSVSKHIGIKREMTYKCLNQLFELGIVDKTKPSNSVTEFQARHPDSLKVLVERKQRASQFAEISFAEAHGYLSSLYNLNAGKPNVQFYEGISGINNLYNDILRVGESVFLVRSRNDDNTEKLNDFVKSQIIAQTKQSITTKAITPFVSTYDSSREPQVIDKKNNVERCIIDFGNDEFPHAQVIIYGDKVSFTAFETGPITTIIDNKEIAQTMKLLFKKIWENNKL